MAKIIPLTLEQFRALLPIKYRDLGDNELLQLVLEKPEYALPRLKGDRLSPRYSPERKSSKNRISSRSTAAAGAVGAASAVGAEACIGAAAKNNHTRLLHLLADE